MNPGALVVSASPAATAPRLLPLHDVHVAAGAHLLPFAGWNMPVRYPLGILGEHLHTRRAAGLFDVSHMGQILVRAHSGKPRDAAAALETLIPTDLESLPAGRQRYGLLTTVEGGIRDDLMIANLGSHWLLVVNAGCAQADAIYLRERLSSVCSVELWASRALLAIQGPHAAQALAAWLPEAAGMRFMDARVCAIDGVECVVTRSGYTGEDGFEISVPADQAALVAARMLTNPAVQWIGLGARDSLRLEAGLCLYGHDLDVETTPVEAALEWAIPRVRRTGGARAGGFTGADVLLPQLEHGASRRRVGFRIDGRPVREGAHLYAAETSDQVVGQVTSGTYAPSLAAPVAMGYVPRTLAAVGTRLFAAVRAERLPVTVSALPFVTHRYQRQP